MGEKEEGDPPNHFSTCYFSKLSFYEVYFYVMVPYYLHNSRWCLKKGCIYKCFDGKLVGEREEGDYFESKNLSWQPASLTLTLLIILPLVIFPRFCFCLRFCFCPSFLFWMGIFKARTLTANHFTTYYFSTFLFFRGVFLDPTGALYVIVPVYQYTNFFFRFWAFCRIT